METSQNRKGFLQKFTAVDLIVIALFALLSRFVFHYIYKALYVVFPWNQAVNPAFKALVLVALLAVVRKPGTTLLWTIAVQLINLFLQGEELIYIVGFIPITLITEFVFWLMKRYGEDLLSAIVGCMVYIALTAVWNWIMLNYIFLVPFELGIALVVNAVAVFVATPIGGFLGHRLGTLLKRSMG